MDDNDNVESEINKDTEKAAVTKEKAKKGNKKKDSGKSIVSVIKSFYQDIFAEFKKVIWPSRDELIKQTGTVVIASLIIGAVICGFDYIFGFGYDLLMKFISL